MTPSLCLFLVLLISEAHSLICPQSQTIDTHRICQIFVNTNIDNIPEFYGRNFSDNNYCNWEMFWTDPIINCENSTSETIKHIVVTGLHGTLDFTYPWPDHLIELDIEQYAPYDTAISGEWNWQSLQYLNDLEEIDLEDNLFTGKLTNDIWNIIASLPSLKYLILQGNKFETDFSEINIYTPSSTIREIEITSNWNFYGTMNVSSFFNSFPQLRTLDLEWHNIYGYFPNLDMLHNIRNIRLDHNHFSGKLTFSDGAGFHENLQRFQIDYNEFSGEINWNIFANSYKLTTLDINNNYFEGTIDWNIISNLINNGVLDYIHLNHNNFRGYADFSLINNDNIDLYLDEHIHCDPIIYPCPGGISADRTTSYCYSKASCESTCQCIPTPKPTISPTEYTLIPTHITSLPTISPTDDDARVNTLHTQIDENDSVSANNNPNGMISMSTLIIFLSMIMCCSCFCVIIGIIIGCYSFKISMKQNNLANNNVIGPPNMIITKTVSYEINDMINETELPKLPNEEINEGVLPKLPKEQYSDDINYDPNIISNSVDDEQKQTEFEVVPQTNNGIDNGENSPLTPIDDNNLSLQNRYTDNKEGNCKILNNHKSESNSEALYVMHSPKSTKGKNKLPFNDNVSLMSVQVIDEDNENI